MADMQKGTSTVVFKEVKSGFIYFYLEASPRFYTGKVVVTSFNFNYSSLKRKKTIVPAHFT